ncbi:peptidoglycan D,D-transpeptidase FtsI family protein [Pantanalinema sp. GBBB05]|uniref:peptidoglycan D,D-transpeptidase FtsI family protein n=1 Tax=Pantanalinema sp. GBBB05 TaxID=2604139 RepID=UPI001D7DB380|nr:penicillin-binding protein 2 [Pantanalinema sp. GBBB05]
MAGSSYTARSRQFRRWLARLNQVKAPPWAETPRFRAVLVWGLLMASTGLLAINLFHLQVIKAPVLKAIAQQQQVIQVRPFIPRRSIVDRVGTVLALDRPVFTLFAHPKLFQESKTAIAEKLAPILGHPVAELVKKFDQQESGIRLEYALTEDVADRIDDLRLDGLEMLQHQERLYPHQELAADIIGYVNDEHRGQAGIELSQQTLLDRTEKAMQLRRMGDGSIMPDLVPGGFLSVDDLHLQLTIDSRLQRIVERALKQQVQAFNAKRGTVIIMDVRDGSLLALVNTPTFDPNQYYKAPIERLKNWAISDLYEPGSTFKPINVAVALEAGTINPDTVFDVPGEISREGWPIVGGAGGGSMSVGDIVALSNNVGMVFITETMKPEAYYKGLKRIGIGELTGIDLPSETAGQFADQQSFVASSIVPATVSFGQGFSLTPVQLAQLTSAIANGGKLMTPHLVQGLYDSKGRLYWQPKLPVKQVFSAKTSKALLPMMERVVDEGTGKAAQLDGYRVGGKTGTAQKATAGGGYSEHAFITSFVGVLPIEDPRYVIVAVIDEPQGDNVYGGTVAAPIVKTIMEELVTLGGLPPSAIPKGEAADSSEEDY